MDLVSVVIPTYKRSDKIGKAIESVLNQTYNNIEIIVVDDNANFPEERENTKKVVEKYKNERIVYIQNKVNLGGAKTRNVGINKSKGNYIAFLDDDDEFLQTKIEKQMKLMKQKELEKKNVAMIYCYKEIIDTNGNTVWISNVNVEGNCLFEHLKQCVETTSTWLCKKEALLKVQGFEDVKAHQDNILLIKLLAQGYEIYRVPEVLLKFYLHNGNGITKRNKNYIEYTKYLIQFKRKFYDRLTKKQIEEVEYSNSSLLLNLYLQNYMKTEYKRELLKVLKSNKFRRHTVRMILDFLKLKENYETKNKK